MCNLFPYQFKISVYGNLIPEMSNKFKIVQVKNKKIKNLSASRRRGVLSSAKFSKLNFHRPASFPAFILSPPVSPNRCLRCLIAFHATIRLRSFPFHSLRGRLFPYFPPFFPFSFCVLLLFLLPFLPSATAGFRIFLRRHLLCLFILFLFLSLSLTRSLSAADFYSHFVLARGVSDRRRRLPCSLSLFYFFLCFSILLFPSPCSKKKTLFSHFPRSLLFSETFLRRSRFFPGDCDGCLERGVVEGGQCDSRKQKRKREHKEKKQQRQGVVSDPAKRERKRKREKYFPQFST